MKISEKKYLLILFIIALLVRCVYFFQFQSNPFFDHVPEAWDQATYDKGAQAFANANILAADPGTANIFSPLYQYFIGIIYYLFGRNLQVVWVVQFLLGITSTFLVYAIANNYFKPAVSFTAALLYTFYGVNWIYESTLYRATFCVFLEMMSCFLLIMFAKRPNLTNMVLSAVFLSFFMQSRSNYILVVPLAFAYLWKKVFRCKDLGRKLLVGYVLIFLLTSLPLLGWVRIVHGKWDFYDQTGPENLLLANMIDHDARVYEHNENYKKVLEKIPMKTLAVSRYLIQTALEHPLKFLNIYLLKIYYYFNNFEVPNTLNFYLFQEHSPILKWVSIPFAFLGSLGIVGFILLWKHRKSVTLLHGYFLANILMFLPFLVLSRYRLTMVPFLSLFSAYSIWVVSQNIKRGKWTHVFILLAGISLLSFLLKTNPLPEGKIRVMDYINMGAAFSNNSIQEDDYKSYGYYKRAWNLSRTLEPNLYYTNAILSYFRGYYIKEAEEYRRNKNLQKELGSLEKALFFDYSSALAHYNYGLALYKSKKNRKAFLQILQTVALFPEIPSSHIFLGMIYDYDRQKPLWALYHLQKAHELLEEGEEKNNISFQIKKLQNQIKHENSIFQSSPKGFFENIQKALKKQIAPLINFYPDLTLPDITAMWSIREAEQYLISLYQHLILYRHEGSEITYYQIGMLYWKKLGVDYKAFYYFEKAWDRGIQFPEFADLLNKMYKKHLSQPIN